VYNTRPRGLGYENVSGWINRQIVRTAQLSHTNARAAEFVNHFHVGAAQHRYHMCASIGHVQVGLRRIMGETHRKRGLGAAGSFWSPRRLLLRAAAGPKYSFHHKLSILTEYLNTVVGAISQINQAVA
jgi:hypothetical protein